MTYTLARSGFLALALTAVLTLGATAQTPAPAQTAPAAQPKKPTQQTFATPEAAAETLTEAIRKDDDKTVAAILGAGWRDLVPGSREEEDQVRKEYLAAWDEAHKIVLEGDKKALIQVGKTAFNMAIPIVKDGDGWRFDVEAGQDEIQARYIGRNELTVVQTLLAIVDAQDDYAKLDPMKTGVATYARRLLSSPGRKDGLYWEAKPGEPESPLGPLVAKAQPGAQEGDGYFGYHYRLLYGQGPAAKGGAYSYLVNDRMIGGFGVIAWPVHYGETGVMTFIVNQDGEVYEQDLGPNTSVRVSTMNIFNPDKGWEKADTTPP
jgi:hypothetical protein